MHASHPYIKNGKQYAFTRCNVVISFELLPRADLIPLNMPKSESHEVSLFYAGLPSAENRLS